MSKTTNTNPTTTTTTALYQRAFKHTLTALNSINSRHYSQTLTDLINQVGNDKKALNSIEHHNNLQTHKNSLDTDYYQEVNRLINRVTTPQADKEQLLPYWAEVTADLQDINNQLKDLNNQKALNFSDLMDSVQEYLLGTLEDITPKNSTKAQDRHQLIIDSRAEQHTKALNPYILPQFNASQSAQFFYSQFEELQQEHIQELELLYNGKSYVTRYIRSNKAPNQLDGTTTKWRDATADEVKSWIEQGHETSTSTSHKEYYIQLNNQDRISLFYKDNRYQFRIQHATYKKGISIENFRTEKGEIIIDGLTTTYNMYADSIGALERLENLINLANLAERERVFIKAFCSKSAINKQGKAHIEYFNKFYDNAIKHNNHKQFYTNIEKHSYLTRLNYSFDRIGITAPSTKTMFIKRLLGKLNKAKKHYNFIELIKTDHEYINHLMTTNRGISNPTLNNHKDLLQFTNKGIKWTKDNNNQYNLTITPTAPTSCIKWTTSNIKPQPITAEEKARAEQDEKHRQELCKIYQFKLDLYKSLRDSNRYNNNGTYSAKYSAFTFFNNLPERNQLQVANARLDEIAKAKAKAEALKQKPRITMQEYCKMVSTATAEEKAEIQNKYYISLV